MVRASHAEQCAVSLDKPLIFGGERAPAAGDASAVCVLKTLVPVALATAALGVWVYGGDEYEEDDGGYTRSKPAKASTSGQAGNGGENRLKAVGGAVANGLSGLKEAARNVVPKRRQFLPVDEWSACELSARKPLGNSFSKYTFALGSPAETFGLKLGESLKLMALDEAGKVCRSELYPASPAEDTGAFDIILKDSAFVVEDEERRFALMVEGLSVGDQVACKPGEDRMTYSGPDDVPIGSLHCVVAGLGALPALEMLRVLLPGRESSIDTANFIWVNEGEDDFGVCYDEVEGLYYRHSEVLEIACVVEDKGVDAPDLFQNEAFLEVLPMAYKPGDLVVVAGPPTFKENVRLFLQGQRFPDGVVVVL